MSKSISRCEPSKNRIRVISNDRFDGLQNQLWQLDEELGVQHYTGDAKVFWAGKSDEQSQWEFGSQNVVYYKTEIIERELTDEEKEWCEDTFMYSGDSMPEILYEIKIPKPEKLKKAIQKNELDQFDKLTAKIPDRTTREEFTSNFQEKIARNNYRYNQLSFYGHPHDLDPEWHPEHCDDTKEELKDKAMMRSDAYKDSWQEIFNLSYYQMKKARYTATSLHEPRITASDPSHKLVELGVIDKTDKSYCRFCGSVWPEDELLHPEMRGYDNKTFRSCETCAEHRIGRAFTNDSFAEALDARAIRTNRQRRLHSNFS